MKSALNDPDFEPWRLSFLSWSMPALLRALDGDFSLYRDCITRLSGVPGTRIRETGKLVGSVKQKGLRPYRAYYCGNQIISGNRRTVLNIIFGGDGPLYEAQKGRRSGG